MNSTVSVIIPNWNGKHLLKLCLLSLHKQTLKKFEIIVVDNGSVDGSIKYIEKYFPKVKVISLDKNYGFAKAINIGIQQAVGKYLILINNDTEVDNNCLEYLVKAAQNHREVGFVAAKMLNFYKRDIIDSAGDYIDNVGHANNIGMGQQDELEFNKPGYVFLVTGGGGLFKREIFNKVGFFDEHYFAYFEDVDLCLRAQMQGFKGWFEPKARIYHIHKATSSKFKSFTEYLQFRNMMMTVIKDFPTTLILKNFVMIILVNLNTILFFTTKRFLWEALKAEGYILINLPRLFRDRVRIQGSKIVSDKYLLQNFREKKITFWGLQK